jgi:hypothetical protein
MFNFSNKHNLFQNKLMNKQITYTKLMNLVISKVQSSEPENRKYCLQNFKNNLK